MTDIEVKKDRKIGRLFDWFEPDLAKFFEGFRPFEDRMRVEEEVVGDDLVIRAEVPGVDPDKDVEITLDNEVLTVSAERRKEETSKIEGGFRSEFRYGSFTRSIRLPARSHGEGRHGHVPRRHPRGQSADAEDRDHRPEGGDQQELTNLVAVRTRALSSCHLEFGGDD